MATENGHDDGEGNKNTVFIDTSLETHLAMIVHDSDTVSDLKRKIVLEHRQCFPAIGDIKINCLKVKRRGNYYHLVDSMLVKSAFGASQKYWFLSVDASHIEQCHDGIQHKPDNDQLALPWVTESLSNDNQVDRPSKLSLIHGSPSNHPKIVPFVNQKSPSVDQFTSDDSCKKVSKNIEEDRSSKQLDSKVEEEKLDSVDKEIKSKKRTRDLHNEDASVKKRLKKTQRTEVDVKGLEEDRVLTDDVDMIGTSMNGENSIEDNSKSKDVVTEAMNDEHTRTMLVSQKKKKPKKTKKGKSSQTQTEESEIVPDVAMVLENNIQQETPFQSSQKEKCNELVDIGNEIPSSMKGVTAEDEMVVNHADDLVVDISSTVPTSVFDEKSEILEKTLVEDSVVDDNEKGDDLTVKEVKILEPTESKRSRKEIKETAGIRIKKKDVGKSSKKDEIKNDAATGTNEDNILTPERKESLDDLHVDNDAENIKNETKTSQENAQVSENQNENMNDSKKKRKKRKSKKKKNKPAEDDANVNLLEKIADVSKTDGDNKLKSKDAHISNEGLMKTPTMNHISSKTDHSDIPSKLELESVKSKIPEVTSENVIVSQVPKGNDVNSNVDIPKEGESHEIDFIKYFSPTQQPNKTTVLENVENGKDTKLSVSEKQSKKKSKEQELLVSKKVPEASTDKVNKMKTPKTRKKINAKPTMGQNNQVKNMKKSAPVTKKLLNTHGEIFGDDSSNDTSANNNENAKTINSDSSTRTPSRKLSSSDESDSSIDSRRYVKRKEGAGKMNVSSQSWLKKLSMTDILKSSSRFKRAKVSASQQVNDTESQPVDFVPESQHVG